MSIQQESIEHIDAEAFEAKCHEDIRAWVKEKLGGEVFDIVRLERWRPQWKVSYKHGEERNTVLFRGNRPNSGKNDLRFEMEVMQVLEANGIKVPHIYGWAESPKAFVMAFIDSEDRAPGMLHTAVEVPQSMPADRWQAMLNYMEHLAQAHAVPLSEFSAIRRLSKVPESPRDIALHAVEKMYSFGKYAGTIDPPLELIQQWLRNNVPEHRTEACFITGDAGQFMSDGDEVLAMLDFEIANVGDNHWDLACFRGRHPYENMGDIPALYKQYEKVTGKPVDLPVVCYHTVAFLQLAVIGATFFGMPEMRGGNWIEGTMEYASITRRAYEAIAELENVKLSYDLKLPEPVSKPWESSGLKKLMVDIQRLPTSNSFTEWERQLLYQIPEFLLNYSQHRDWFESESLSDINLMTGHNYTSLAEADAATMQIFKENQLSNLKEWIAVMHRRMLRLTMIITNSNFDERNPLFYRLEPILSRG